MGNVNQAMKPSNVPLEESSKAKASTSASSHTINVADVVKAELLKKKPDVFRHSLSNQPPTQDNLSSLQFRNNSNKSPASPSGNKSKTTKTDHPFYPQVRPFEKAQAADQKPTMNPGQPSSNDQIAKNALLKDGTGATLQFKKASIQPVMRKRNENATANAVPKGGSTPRPTVDTSKQSTSHSAERPNWTTAPSNPSNTILSRAKNDAQLKHTLKETGRPKQETTHRSAMTVLTKDSPAQNRVKKTNTTGTTTKAKDGHLAAHTSGKPSVPSQSSAPMTSHSSDRAKRALALDTTGRGQDLSQAATSVSYSKQLSHAEQKDKQSFLCDKTNAQAASGVSRNTSDTFTEIRNNSPRRLTIDKDASARFIKAALSSNSKNTKKQRSSIASYAEAQEKLLQAAHSASSASLLKDSVRANPGAGVSNADAPTPADLFETLAAKSQMWNATAAINAQMDSPSRSSIPPEGSESISASSSSNVLPSRNHREQCDTRSEIFKAKSVSAECIHSVLQIHSSPKVLDEIGATSCCGSPSTDVQVRVNIPMASETSVISATHGSDEASTSQDPPINTVEGNSHANELPSVSSPSPLSGDTKKNYPKLSDSQVQDTSVECSKVLDEQDSIFTSSRRRDAVRPVKISVNAAAKADMASWLAGPSVPPTPIKAAEAKSKMGAPTSVKIEKIKTPIRTDALCAAEKCEVASSCDNSKKKESKDIESPDPIAARSEAFVTPIKQALCFTTQPRSVSSRKSGFWDREDIIQPPSGAPDKGWYVNFDTSAVLSKEGASQVSEKDVSAVHNCSEHISGKYGVQGVHDSESQPVDFLLSSNSAEAIYSSTPVKRSAPAPRRISRFGDVPVPPISRKD